MHTMQKQHRTSRANGVLSMMHGSTVVTYDREADAAYFSFKKIKKGEVARTIELQPWLLADLDKRGVLLGVEMLFISHQLTRASINKTLSIMRPLVTA